LPSTQHFVPPPPKLINIDLEASPESLLSRKGGVTVCTGHWHLVGKTKDCMLEAGFSLELP
jgi:hypothetical protein